MKETQNPTSASAVMSVNAEATDRLLHQFVGYRMKRAYLLIQEDMAQTLKPLGLRTGTFSALAVVMASPGISQTALSEELNIKRSGVVAVVDELERAGVLERRAVKADRRTNSLSVTRVGKHLWEKAEQAVQKHEKLLFADLEPDEVSQLRELLTKVVKSAGQRGGSNI